MVGFEVHAVLARLQASGAAVEVDDANGDILHARVRVDGAWIDVTFPSYATLDPEVIRVLQDALACELSGAGHGVAVRSRDGSDERELGISPGEADGAPVVWINTLESQLKTWIRLIERGGVMTAAAD